MSLQSGIFRVQSSAKRHAVRECLPRFQRSRCPGGLRWVLLPVRSESSRQSDLQLELGVTLDPRLRMILAILWAITLLSMAIVLWSRKPISRVAIPVLLTLYAVYRLAIVGIFAESEYARGSQITTAILYSGAILFTIWALNRKTARKYFADLQDGQGNDSSPPISVS